MENQPNYQQPYSNNPQVPLPNATPVLVLGIISIVGCFCYGLVGLVCGIICMVMAKKDMKLYKENPGAYTEGSFNNLKAGRVCGIIGLSLSSLYFLIILVYIIIFGTIILSHPTNFFNHSY
jgi:hypothetical protein